MGRYTIEDLMDRSSEIDRVCAIVGNLSENEHTCIAIEGNWGCGKTYVMNILQGEFEKDSNNIVIKYDAWENSYYDDPLITILYCILDKLKAEVTNDKALKKIVKATLKEAKKDWDKVKDNILKKISEVGKECANFKIALACCLIEKIVSIGKTATTSLLDNAKFSDFKSYQSLLSDTKDFLNALTARSKSKDGTKGDCKKIILLVDEVDRCLPNQQLIILERLHHLLQVNNSAVIVALNKTIVKEAYENRYCVASSSLGDDYLKKFFDYEINLYDAQDLFLKSFIIGYLEKYLIKDRIESRILASDICYFIYKISRIKYEIKLDARNIRKFVEKLQEILERENIQNIDYLKFWFTLIMLYSKMFNLDVIKYNEFKEGNIDRVILFDISSMLNMVCETTDSISYMDVNKKIYTYYIYEYEKYNDYQYILNYCLFRNGDGSGLDQLKSIAQRKEDYDWIDNMFKTIDKYYIG